MDAMGIELEEQRDVWARLWERRAKVGEALRGVSRPGLGRMLLTGCGDCHAAAEYGESLFELRTSLGVRGLAAMELTRAREHLLGPNTLLVAMSVSGRTPRVLEAVRAARRRGSPVLGVTDDPSGDLAREADRAFVLGAAPPAALVRTDYADAEAARYTGYERPVPQTKTFGALQFFLALLCLQAEGLRPSGRGSPAFRVERALEELSRLASPAAAAAGEAARRLAARTRPGGLVTFAGTGLAVSSARFASYKLLELARPSLWTDAEEFCHTAYLVTGPGDAVVFLVQDGPTVDRVGEIVPVVEDEVGAAAVVFSTAAREGSAGRDFVGLPSVPVEVAPLLLAHAASHLVRGLAAAWGVNTDRFRAGLEEERYVRGSTRMIRQSRIVEGP